MVIKNLKLIITYMQTLLFQMLPPLYIYTHYMYVSRYIPQESSGSAGHPKLKVDAVGKAEEGEHNLADG